MVLASMINKRQRAEGYRQGVKQTAKRSNANLRALAKKYDIPEEDLPLLDEDYKNDENA